MYEAIWGALEANPEGLTLTEIQRAVGRQFYVGRALASMERRGYLLYEEGRKYFAYKRVDYVRLDA
ncbi:MAG: hypothetical protein HPY45_14845 [Anaerolineae bacterium]|nr:hypothetical protein [Anaerolineae bacterium]